jgi:hypothetical protein
MEQSPSREAHMYLASHDTPRILWNTEVYCRIHNGPQPVAILNQIEENYDK